MYIVYIVEKTNQVTVKKMERLKKIDDELCRKF